MKTQLTKVQYFQDTFKQPVSQTPTLISREQSILRFGLMKEENKEYLQATEDNDLVEVADALGDQLYVLLGTINTHGMQHIIEKVFNEIHASNLSKLDDNGNPVFRSDGKVLKSKNFFEPNLKQFL